jgi:hypothetical protein
VTSPEIFVAGLLEVQTSLQPTTQWQLRPATVTLVGATAVLVKFDGEGFNGTETVNVPAISLVGFISLDVRVMILTVPPAGNYVISIISAPHGPTRTLRMAGPVVPQTKADVTFASMVGTGGAVTISDFVKSGNDSNIAIAISSSVFSSATATSVELGVTIDGVDTAVAYHLFNVTNTHLGFSGMVDVADVLAGTYDIEVKWRRVLGAGTLTWDNNDYVSVRAYETP